MGIDDPEEWLNRTSPRTLALWDAFYQVEPWGAEFERSAIQSQLLETLISVVAATAGQKIKPHKMADYMPANWVGNKPFRQKKLSGRKQMQAAKQICAAIFPTADKR